MKSNTYSKYLFLTALLFCIQPLFANMAAPYQVGRSLSAPFTAEHVNVIHQQIKITPSANFERAQFEISYEIESEKSGDQIPMLFHAPRYQKGFNVWVNDEIVPIEQAENHEELIRNLFEDAFDDEGEEHVRIYWNEKDFDWLTISDLIFFRMDVPVGRHTIRVKYEATAAVDYAAPVKRWDIVYSLFPIQYWKDFAQLELVIDHSHFPSDYSTNLDGFTSSETENQTTWTFDELPDDYITLSYTPEISAFASWLINHGFPFVFGMYLLVFIGVHLLLLRLSIRSKLVYNTFFWLGIVVVPFLIVLIPTLTTGFIDAQIGEAASRRHGYEIVSVMTYPIVLVMYGFLLWAIRKWAIKPASGSVDSTSSH